VSLSLSVGPPTTEIQIGGSGFGARETVALSFDETPVGQATADGSGAFAGVEVEVPASAAPGVHAISATGESSGLSASGSFRVRTNWSMLGFGPQRRSENPYENVLGAGNVAGLHVHWSLLTGSVVRTSPAVASGKVYVPCANALCALDADSGALDWSYPTGATTSSPAAWGGTVFAACGSGLCALSASSGALLWSHAMGGIFGSPAVSAGVAYVVADRLFALSARTGALLWSYANGDAAASPAVSGGAVYVACAAGLCALDASTGALLWSAPYLFPGAGPEGSASPAVSGGVVYLSSGTDTGKGLLVALDAKTGALLWTYRIGHPFDSSPAISKGLVYAGTEDGQIWAIRIATGTRAWNSGVGGHVYSTPVLANGVLYVANAYGDSIVALNATTGGFLWRYRAGAATDASPAIADGTVYIGSDDHTIYAFGL
jgi:outer membrane protein assembly factor BamB